MQHDFFIPQPVRDADVYFIRKCFHNYNDTDCKRILQALVPALACCPTGTPLLINDIVLPEPGREEGAVGAMEEEAGAKKGKVGYTRFEEHELRRLDIMLVLRGAKQKTARDFEQLVRNADERFNVSRQGLLFSTSWGGAFYLRLRRGGKANLSKANLSNSDLALQDSQRWVNGPSRGASSNRGVVSQKKKTDQDVVVPYRNSSTML